MIAANPHKIDGSGSRLNIGLSDSNIFFNVKSV